MPPLNYRAGRHTAIKLDSNLSRILAGCMEPDVTLLDHLGDDTVHEQIAVPDRSSIGISRHLSPELLSSYRLGVIAPGAALAVEAHIGLCEQCRREAGLTEHPGPNAGSVAPPGVALDCVGAVDDPSAAGVGAPALGRAATGPLRRVGRGVRHSQLGGVSGLGESVHLLTAEPGAPLNLPSAAHLLVVLGGAVQAGASIHSRGDFIDTASVRLKEASVHGASDCLCLVVGDDSLFDRPTIDLRKRAFAGAKPRR
jgi:anti-sigma factor ChrR (cupin superfamily)